MDVTYKVEMTRKTYDGICAYLQTWGGFYSQPTITMVLRGSVRGGAKKGVATGLVVEGDTGWGDPQAIAKRFNTALCGLGRADVHQTKAVVDLRDLSDEQLEAFQFAAEAARLKPQQVRALKRIEAAAREFKQLPPLVRIALAGVD